MSPIAREKKFPDKVNFVVIQKNSFEDLLLEAVDEKTNNKVEFISGFGWTRW